MRQRLKLRTKINFMTINFRFIFYILIIQLVAFSAHAEWIPLGLSVDGRLIGDLPVQLGPKSQVLSLNGFKLAEKLKAALLPDKISRIKTLTNLTTEAITIEDLARVGITTSYNEKELRIALNIPLDIRVIKDFPVIFERDQAGLALYNKNYSGFLNIRGTVGYSGRSELNNYTYQKNPNEAQLELVQNLNYFTLESTAQYKEFEQKPFQRENTSLVHDFEKEQIRLKLGDYATGVQGFQSSLPSAGVQVQKQFNIYPDRGSINKKSTLIQVKNNSLLEVYINSNLISRLRVGPGPYNLKDLPLLYGRNKVRVILLDDFGGREEFEVDLLFDDQILAKGVNDFNYQVGRPSFFSINEKEYVDDTFSSFFHKYGLTDELTLFTNYQNYLSSNLFGLGLGVLTQYGTHFFDLGYYTDNTVDSSTASRWRYNSPDLNFVGFERFRLVTSVESRSSEFKSISLLTPTINNFANKYDFILQKQLTDKSSASVGLTKTIGQNFGTDDLSRRFTYQNQFVQNWRFDLSYSWTDRQPDFDQIILSLNWFEPAGKAQAAFSHDTLDNNSTVRYGKTNQLNYNDLQIDMTASKQKSRTTDVESQSVNFNANYYAAKYETRLQINGNSGSSELNHAAQLGLGTALAWTQDGYGLSRPITDAFAIVEAQGLSRAQTLTIPNGIERDSLKIKNNESFVFSSLTSYIERPLQLDSTGLGSASHLDREAYILNPKYRSGLFVPLKVIKSLIVRGRLASKIKEQVAYANGRVYNSSGQIFSENFFTDESGNFVIDGLSYGEYQIALSDPRLKKIKFVIEASEETVTSEADESDDSEYELGTLKIEKETGT